MKYECYDDKDRRINTDTLHNSDLVDEIFYVKSFFDLRYSAGVDISQPYITNKVLVFSKVAANTWTAVDMTNNNTTELKGNIDKIVRADTTIAMDPATGGKQLTVRKYYNVTEIPAGERHVNMHTH